MDKNNNTNSMQKVNYQKLLDKITDRIERECTEGKERPTLFLHACCAPCSSYVLEYLVKYFKITIFYYNPNITPETEYIKRVKELQRFIQEAGYEQDVTFVEGTYDPQVFFDMAKGMEDLPERGLRCYHCYALRMEEAAKKAAETGADYFTTTLSNTCPIFISGKSLSSSSGFSAFFPYDLKNRSSSSFHPYWRTFFPDAVNSSP